MFSLLLTVCMGSTGFCAIEAPPVDYPSLRRCQEQAAIIAGMVKGDFIRPGYPVAQTLTVECSAIGETVTITITIGGR